MRLGSLALAGVIALALPLPRAVGGDDKGKESGDAKLKAGADEVFPLLARTAACCRSEASPPRDQPRLRRIIEGEFAMHDGEINAYERQADGSYERVGALRDENHRPILIDGLWALSFGKGAITANGPTDTLFFTAGPDDEQHGLFGSIRAR